MFELDRSIVSYVRQRAVSSVAECTLSSQEIESQAVALLAAPSDDAYYETLVALDADATNRRLSKEKRQLAKAAIYLAPVMYPDNIVRSTAGLAYSLAHAENDEDIESYIAQFTARRHIRNNIPGFSDSTIGKRLPTETTSEYLYRSFMYISDLFSRVGSHALKDLQDNFGIQKPTAYPIDMLVDQLERDEQHKGKPEALIMVSRDDDVGALHDDPVYKSIAMACAKPKAPVLPTFVEFGNGIDEFVLNLSEPRNLALGFINSHGNWDNIDGMEVDALYRLITSAEKRAIARNWRQSAGMGLLSCYGGAQSSVDSSQGADATLAKLIKNTVVASDDMTDIVSVTRRTGVLDRWVVNFHMPKGSDKVATTRVASSRHNGQRSTVLDCKTVFYDSIAA